MSEHPLLTEDWDTVEPVAFLPSRLYRLAPVGMGTPEAESLASYLTRLAYAHRVSVAALVRYEIQPWLGEGAEPRPRTKHHALFWFRDIRQLNGLNAVTQSWVSTLNRLTGRTDLVGSTMLRWRQVISPLRLLRDERAWCPSCYAEDKQTGRVYDRLLWTLRAVTWCRRHGQTLVSVCGRCEQTQPVLARYGLVGSCIHCGQWLGETRVASRPDDADWQAQVTAAAESLVAGAAAVGQDPPTERIAAILGAVVGRGYGQGVGSVSRRLQMGREFLNGWQRGKVPQLANLIRFSIGVAHSPAALLTDPELSQQRQVVERQRCAGMPARVAQPHVQQRDWEAIAALLQRMASTSEQEPCSMRAIGRQLGISVILLRQHCPKENRQIAERYKAHVRARGQQRRATLAQAIQQAVQQLHDAGVVPTQKRVTEVLMKPGALREPEMRATWQAACRALEGGGSTDRNQERLPSSLPK
jgi:hypothetical protein